MAMAGHISDGQFCQQKVFISNMLPMVLPPLFSSNRKQIHKVQTCVDLSNAQSSRV